MGRQLFERRQSSPVEPVLEFAWRSRVKPRKISVSAPGILAEILTERLYRYIRMTYLTKSCFLAFQLPVQVHGLYSFNEHVTVNQLHGAEVCLGS
jgi:hypothetical protein